MKSIFDQDNIFEKTLDDFNQTFGPADTGEGGQYATAADQAAADNEGKSFFGATSYSYPIGDNILKLSTDGSTSAPTTGKEDRIKKWKGAFGLGKGDIQTDARAEYFVGGPNHEGLDPELHNMDIYNQQLVGYRGGAAYGTPTLVGFYDENNNFKSLTYADSLKALAQGNVNVFDTYEEFKNYDPQAASKDRDRGSPPGRSRERPPRKKSSEEETETDTTLQPFTPVNTEFPEAVSNFAAPVQIRSGSGPNIVSTPFTPGESLLSQVGDLEMENTKFFNRGGPVDRGRPPGTLKGYPFTGEFDTMKEASLGSEIGDLVEVGTDLYVKTAGEPDSGINSYLKPLRDTFQVVPDNATAGGDSFTAFEGSPFEVTMGDNGQPPAFLPGQQGNSPFAGTNLGPAGLDRNRPPSGGGVLTLDRNTPPSETIYHRGGDLEPPIETPPDMYFYRPGVGGGQGSIFSLAGGQTGRAKDDIQLTEQQYNQIQNRGIENFEVVDGRLVPATRGGERISLPIEDTDSLSTANFDPMNLENASQGLGNIALQMATGILPYDVRYDVDGDGNITAAEALQIYKGEYDPFSYQAEGTGSADTGGTGSTGTGSTGTGSTDTGGTSTITTIMPTGYNAIVPQNITSTGMTPGNNLVNQIIPGTPYTYVNTPGGQMAVSPPSVSTFNPLSGGVNTYAGPTGLASLLSGDGSGSITASQPIYYSSSLYEPLPGLTTGQLLGLGTPSQADANALMKLLQNAQGTGTTDTTDTSGNTGV